MDDNIETPLGFWGSSAEEMLVRHFPVHRACRDGDSATLSRVISEATPDQLVAEDQFYSWTPIHWAAYFGKNECLLLLLQRGVNVNVRTSRFQQAPIHIASFGGHVNTLIELLKAGADSDTRDFLGESPLHKAARVGAEDCIKTLISHGTPILTCNSNGLTACDIAREQNFRGCAHLMELAHMKQGAHQNNGLLFENGSSGSHLSRLNGHANGINGFNNHACNRKRAHDDVSMPFLKRPRTSENVFVNGGQSALVLPKKCDVAGAFPPGVPFETEMEDASLERRSVISGISPAPAEPSRPSAASSQFSVESCGVQSRQVPQYEDELYSADIDFPYWC